VSLWRLIENHAQFHNRVIRVKAILVENQTPRVDGGDPILYDVACPDSDFSVVVLFADSFKSNAAYAALRRINDKPDASGKTCATVSLFGKFEVSSKREYGHLDWADSQFVIYRIEKTSPVAPNAIWPKKFK